MPNKSRHSSKSKASARKGSTELKQLSRGNLDGSGYKATKKSADISNSGSATTSVDSGFKKVTNDDDEDGDGVTRLDRESKFKSVPGLKSNFNFTAGQSSEKGDVNDKLKSAKIQKPFSIRLPYYLNVYVAPVLLTLLSFYLRHYQIGANNTVVWDEAHFAKFGSFYNKHTFYHDVHPPLGKMLCGLSEWLVGYQPDANPDYMFESGSTYPDQINYYGMRLFQVFFSSAITPIAWFTCRSLKKSLLTTYLITLMVCLDSSFIVLGKFVLLDSFLFFFTGTTYLCLAQVNRYRSFEGKSAWADLWYLLLGLSIGCVCSVKWVGLFVTAVVGVYTVVDLWAKFWDPSYQRLTYFKFWVRRIFNLIIVPICVYLFFFKIHLDLLYLPGDGSGSMNTLFQANMAQTDIVAQSRFVQLGDEITLRSQGMNSNLLHSHQQVYPAGSRQHQVTTYGYKDANNNWRISNSRSDSPLIGFIKDGDVVRLTHIQTGSNLHSHLVPGHVSKKYWEVSGYGSEEIGDEKDDWIVEIVTQLHSSNKTYAELHENDYKFETFVHPVSTTFRLKHKVLGCYLGTTGKSYPTWGFQQGEVVCLEAPEIGSLSAYFDSSANWNIESVVSTSLPADDEYSYPKSSFFKDFIQLQRSMAASNNALTPDPSKNDNIASSWWEWPLMRSGIRMSGWSPTATKFYMFGNPIMIWFSTACVAIYTFLLLSIIRRWRAQQLSLDESSLWKLFTSAILPFLGYIFHYLPFIVMGRVTYFHHYMPALYFAIFMCGFTVDYLTITAPSFVRRSIYFFLYALLISSFWLFSPTCLGMNGPSTNYNYLNWLPTWEIGIYVPFTETFELFTKSLKKHLL